ncbi:MAG: ABC transporter permease [Actinomycetota bacterium]
MDAVATVARPGPAPRDGRGRGGFPPLRGLVPLAAALAVWQVAGDPSSPYFPTPSQWLAGLADLGRSGALVPAAGETLVTFGTGLAVAAVLGTALGVAVGTSKAADRALGPTFEFLRAIPPAAVVPIAALLLGFDQQMKVAVVTFAAVWSVLLNTRAGIRGIDPVLVDTARSLHLSRLDTARKVLLPALAPWIFVGVRVAAPVALVITLLVEILTRVGGIGALMAVAQRSYLAGQVYGLILMAGLFSLAVSGLVSALEARLFRHHPPR